MSELIKKFMVKATKSEGEEIRRSLNWVFAKRGLLKIYDDHLECGSWSIQYADIDEAVIFSFRSLLLIPGHILRVRSKDVIYQFGLNSHSYWKGELPFEASREKRSLKYSLFSIALRVLAMAYLVYLVWMQYGR